LSGKENNTGRNAPADPDPSGSGAHHIARKARGGTRNQTPPTKYRRLILSVSLAALLVLGILVTLLPPLLFPDRLPSGDWKLFRKNFISGDGRVVDTGNNRVSHSEGQGYGMLLAAAFHDRATFDLIWKWTRDRLQKRKDKLFSWQWTPGPEEGGGAIADPNNASDGDLLIAWALFRAHKLWGDYAYQQASAAILIDLSATCLTETRFGLSLLPAEIGFKRDDGVILNPSYSIFEAYHEMRGFALHDEWQKLDESGVALIKTARFGKWDLSPEWTHVSDQKLSLPEGFPPDFGYNAVRIPLYLAWSDPGSPLLKPFRNYWRSFGVGSMVPASIDLQTDVTSKDPALPGMLAIAQLTDACVEGRRITVRQIPRLTRDESYYSASLKLLTKVAISEINQRRRAAEKN